MSGLIETYLDSRSESSIAKKLEISQKSMEKIFNTFKNDNAVTEVYKSYEPIRDVSRISIKNELRKFTGLDVTIEVGTAINLMTKASDIDLMIIVDKLVNDNKKTNKPIFDKLHTLFEKLGYISGGEHGERRTPSHWFLYNGYDFENDIEIEIKVRNKADAGDIVTIHNNLSSLDESKSAIIVYMKHMLNKQRWTYAIFKAVLYEWMYSISNVSDKRLFNLPKNNTWKVGLISENPEKSLQWKKKIWKYKF